jgi:succinate-acetate transporter protein
VVAQFPRPGRDKPGRSGNANETNGMVEAGGWFGLATAVAAWYASFAAVVNSTFGRTVLPVRPLGH